MRKHRSKIFWGAVAFIDIFGWLWILHYLQVI